MTVARSWSLRPVYKYKVLMTVARSRRQRPIQAWRADDCDSFSKAETYTSMTCRWLNRSRSPRPMQAWRADDYGSFSKPETYASMTCRWLWLVLEARDLYKHDVLMTVARSRSPRPIQAWRADDCDSFLKPETYTSMTCWWLWLVLEARDLYKHDVLMTVTRSWSPRPIRWRRRRRRRWLDFIQVSRYLPFNKLIADTKFDGSLTLLQGDQQVFASLLFLIRAWTVILRKAYPFRDDTFFWSTRANWGGKCTDHLGGWLVLSHVTS